MSNENIKNTRDDEPTSGSPYDRRAYAYLDRGYSVIPIAPGTKRPGQWSEADGWKGMFDWERWSKRLPTPVELSHWYRWPDAGIGLLTGKLSKIVALDRDYDTNGTDALDRLIPYTPVKKKGAKGCTYFYQYSGERSCSFNINGVRVLDVLSDGRQTLMPGTIHPDGHTYVYLTEDILEDFEAASLPKLPDGFLERVAQVLAPFQTDDDRKYQAKKQALPDNTGAIDTSLSPAGQYFSDLNREALNRLDEWVPKLIPSAKREREGWRAVASWRGAKNPNVGIHPAGIFDFGGNYGMTPIDLVMYANGLSFTKAAETLRELVTLKVEPIILTVNGAPAVAKIGQEAAAPIVLPTLFPWQRSPSRANEGPAVVELPSETSIDPAPAIPHFILNPPGILGDVARWITATAPKAQPELSVAAAIAFVATVMGRTYRSQFANWTSLYLIIIAKSTEGKEHPQNCVEKALAAAELDELIGGSGFTSSGAVYSALLKSPSHIVTIDELGKLLKLSRAKGQSNTEAAIDKLVEAYGRLDGVMRPPQYSDMTQRERVKIPIVHNPAITMLGATTPATFYGALTNDLVHDGFLGRCIVVESKQPRQLTRFVERTDPPQRVIDWAKAVSHKGALTGDLAGIMAPELPARYLPLDFAEPCVTMLNQLEQKLNDEKNASEGEGLDVLMGRTQEKAMRLAMCAAKAESEKAQRIEPHHLAWAIEYVTYYDLAMVRAVRENRIESQVDSDLKRLVRIIAQAKKYAATDEKWSALLGQGVMPHSRLLRSMKCSARQLDDLINTAVEAGLITKAPISAFGGVGAGMVYLAVGG